MKKILLTIAMLGVALVPVPILTEDVINLAATRTGGTLPIAAKTMMIATIPLIRIIAIR